MCFVLKLYFLRSGLRAYEAEQLPEAVAICKLIVHGYPDQYNQQPLRRFIRELFAGIRLIFSRILPTVVSPPIFFLLQDHSLNYRQVCDENKLNLYVNLSY